jgi:hypothetical protein
LQGEKSPVAQKKGNPCSKKEKKAKFEWEKGKSLKSAFLKRHEKLFSNRRQSVTFPFQPI